MKYVIQNRETGDVIDEFDTQSEAEAALNSYEEEDKSNGIYEANFYEISIKKDI